MPIPDSIIFGRNNTTFKKVRDLIKSKDNVGIVDAVDARINHYLIEQAEPLEKGGAFPLAIMCCIMTETLGQIMYPKEKYSVDRFTKSVKKFVDPKFGDTISSARVAKIKANTKTMRDQYFETVGALLYGHFRNSLIHMYATTGFYLSDKPGAEIFYFDGTENVYVINPYKYWNKLKKSWKELYTDARKPSTPQQEAFVKFAKKMVK